MKLSDALKLFDENESDANLREKGMPDYSPRNQK